MDIFRDLQGIPCFDEIDMGDIRELWEFGIAIIIVKKAVLKYKREEDDREEPADDAG